MAPWLKPNKDSPCLFRILHRLRERGPGGGPALPGRGRTGRGLLDTSLEQPVLCLKPVRIHDQLLNLAGRKWSTISAC